MNLYQQRNAHKTEEEYRLMDVTTEICLSEILSQIGDFEQYPANYKIFDNIDDTISHYLLFLLAKIILKKQRNIFLTLGKPSTERKIYSSKSFSTEIPYCRNIILFIHAFTGCDMPSAFFNRGILRFAKL